jgi:L-fucose mutarotase/ribose pyranase (RbsD/FucU family)
VSTNKVAELKNVLEDINNFFLHPTKEILSLYDKGQLKFFERDHLVQYKINLVNKSAINQIFKTDSLSKNYELRSNLNFLSNQTNLSKLSKFMAVLENELNLIEENLKEYLQEMKEEEKLVELEKAMLAKYERTKYLADSLITGEHDNFAGINVADAIINFADAELSTYSNLPSAEEKTQAIESLINCFSRTEELIYTINKAPESIYKINDAYTKEVFNPYTFTNMEEKSKPSIYKAFNKFLLPGIFQNMQHLTCDNMNAFQANFKILYEEMIDLLNEENTNRMERKVKRAKTPAKASEILEMELSF